MLSPRTSAKFDAVDSRFIYCRLDTAVKRPALERRSRSRSAPTDGIGSFFSLAICDFVYVPYVVSDTRRSFVYASIGFSTRYASFVLRFRVYCRNRGFWIYVNCRISYSCRLACVLLSAPRGGCNFAGATAVIPGSRTNWVCFLAALAINPYRLKQGFIH